MNDGSNTVQSISYHINRDHVGFAIPPELELRGRRNETREVNSSNSLVLMNKVTQK